jgi:hypothetical protein
MCMSRGTTWDNNQLISAVQSSKTVADVIRKLNLRPVGGNYRTVKSRIANLGISTAHFLGQGHAKGSTHLGRNVIPLDRVLVKGRATSSHGLKKRLLREGLLKAECAVCGLTQWQGRPISLELDHKNGDPLDNQLINLRLCCPNCHALTPTYRGKNIKIRRRIKRTCADCGVAVSRGATRCTLCANRRPRKVHRKVTDRPSRVILTSLVEKHGYREVGRRYGVSDTTIRKWLLNEISVRSNLTISATIGREIG